MDKIIKIVQERYKSPTPINRNGKVFTWDDYQIEWVIDRLQDVDKKMEYYKQIYKDKCIARKEINEDDIAPAELVIKYPYAVIEQKPDIKTMFDKIIGMGFNYGGLIKDRKTGRILANNIYENVRYQGALGESFIKAFGSESRGYGISCDSGREKYLEVCNQKMIEKFFRKDRK